MKCLLIGEILASILRNREKVILSFASMWIREDMSLRVIFL